MLSPDLQAEFIELEHLEQLSFEAREIEEDHQSVEAPKGIYEVIPLPF